MTGNQRRAMDIAAGRRYDARIRAAELAAYNAPPPVGPDPFDDPAFDVLMGRRELTADELERQRATAAADERRRRERYQD